MLRKSKQSTALLTILAMSAVTAGIPASAEQPMPEGWLLWHSYTAYSAGDSRLFVRSPEGDISEIKGSFVHAMNGSFGNNPGTIVFMAIDPDVDEWDVFLYDDGTIQNLTEHSGYRNEDPKWSPDGKSIVFKRGFWNTQVNDFTYNLALLDVASHTVTPLTDDMAEEAMPFFSDDGKDLYYTQYDGAVGSIMRMHMETGTVETVFAEKGVNAYYPAEREGSLYFTKWHSADNHHDEIIRLQGDGMERMAFCAEDSDCSDACPVKGDSLIYSSTLHGVYALYYYDGTASSAIPGIPENGNALGADFYLCTEGNSRIMGDVNADGRCSTADIILFQKWLLAVPGTKLTDWKAADFFADGQLDAVDLCMMKRELLSE